MSDTETTPTAPEIPTPTIPTNDALMDMYRTNKYIGVKSVSCKRRGRGLVFEFTLSDGTKITV